jgi:hypothetical protein
LDGLWKQSGIIDDLRGEYRILAQYDVIRARTDSDYPGDPPDYDDDIKDYNGHGTHVAAVAVDSDVTDQVDAYQGVAPGAGVVAVRVFDEDGMGTYADVIQGVQWVVSNREEFDIRVVNCSFSAEVRSYYWDDPLNQALMAAWNAGIVVVASAGNFGPGAGTIGVPGNCPYFISVGAMSDGYTPRDAGDDYLASFSAAGPTVEAFVKPDVVAPGAHMSAWMPPDGIIPLEHPEFMEDGEEYFTMSGTSQAAAVVSAVVTMMLQADPSLTPDDVKCRLMATASPATLDLASPLQVPQVSRRLGDREPLLHHRKVLPRAGEVPGHARRHLVDALAPVIDQGAHLVEPMRVVGLELGDPFTETGKAPPVTGQDQLDVQSGHAVEARQVVAERIVLLAPQRDVGGDVAERVVPRQQEPGARLVQALVSGSVPRRAHDLEAERADRQSVAVGEVRKRRVLGRAVPQAGVPAQRLLDLALGEASPPGARDDSLEQAFRVAPS